MIAKIDISSYRVNCQFSHGSLGVPRVPTSTMAAVKRTGHPNRRRAKEDLIVVVGSSLKT